MRSRSWITAALLLPPRRWVDVVLAAVVAARLERALRKGGLDRAAAISGIRVGLTGSAARPGRISDVAFTPREVEKLDTAWRVLKRPPFNGTCLRRALVGGYFLRHRDPLLRIGVRKEGGEVAAHAWIEVSGVSLDPDGSQRFAVLHEPESAP